MKKIAGKGKKRGRPVTTGAGVSIHLRLQPETLLYIDQRCAALEATRQDVIRMFIEQAISLD